MAAARPAPAAPAWRKRRRLIAVMRIRSPSLLHGPAPLCQRRRCAATCAPALGVLVSPDGPAEPYTLPNVRVVPPRHGGPALPWERARTPVGGALKPCLGTGAGEPARGFRPDGHLRG